MKAVRIHEFGGPEVLRVEELPVPEPGEGEVLIRVHAASVNPVDYKIRSGGYPRVRADRLPLILGRDVSGTVERCGPGVDMMNTGELVFAMLPEGGGYAEFATVPAALCASKPAESDYVQAAAVPLAGLTAWQGLFDEGNLQAGQHVLIHGGAGGVGHMAVQLAKIRGAKVSTTCSDEDLDFVRELGADQAIDYKHESFERVVGEVDLVFDLVAGETQERSWNVLKDGGTVVSTLSPPSREGAAAHHARGLNYMARPNGRQLAAMGRLIDSGRLHPIVDTTFPLESAAAAEQRLEHASVRGKLVLQVI
jgi:NADPH:quinone reductase-like Zn-dependent oxidoreductase